MTRTINPFHDNILLEEIAPNEKTGGGIIIPTAHQTKVNQGIVVDKGPDVSDKVKIGDVLFFPLHSESRMEFMGHKFILVTETACLGAIREK